MLISLCLSSIFLCGIFFLYSHDTLCVFDFLRIISEMGYFRILAGHNSLGIEMEVGWATPGQFTVHNFPCYEDGGNCVDKPRMQVYEDPSKNVEMVLDRLMRGKQKHLSSEQKSVRG